MSDEKPTRRRRRKSEVVTEQGRVTKRWISGARLLVLVDSRDPIWGDGTGDPGAALPKVGGAIVQIRPPANATDEAIETLVNACMREGASAVDTMPKEPGGEVLVRKMRAEQRAALTPRQLVLELARKANSKDAEALEALLGLVLDEEGL